MDGIMNFFMNPVFLFIFAIVIIAIVIIIIVVMKMKKDDALRERDDINYGLYKQLLRATTQNANPERIHKTYSLKNILLLGLPIFWNEHSLQLKDMNNVNIGWYRGHSVTALGETVYLAYKNKKWIIFEDLFLVRCMNTHTYTKRTEIIDAKTNKGTGKYDLEEKTTNFSNLYEWLPYNVDDSHKKILKIQCDGISEDGYFHLPNYLRKNGEGAIVSYDLRPDFRKNLIEYTREEQLLRSMTDLSRNIDESARSNPNIAMGRHRVEKTEEEVRRDDQTPQQKQL